MICLYAANTYPRVICLLHETETPHMSPGAESAELYPEKTLVIIQ